MNEKIEIYRNAGKRRQAMWDLVRELSRKIAIAKDDLRKCEDQECEAREDLLRFIEADQGSEIPHKDWVRA